MDNTFKYLFIIRNSMLNVYDHNGELIKLKGDSHIDISEQATDFWTTWEDKAGYIFGNVDFLILDNSNMSDLIPEKYTIQDISWTLQEVSNLLNKSIFVTNHDSIKIDEDDFRINIALESELINSTISSDETPQEDEEETPTIEYKPNTLGNYFSKT